jgi:hypothetical protein
MVGYFRYEFLWTSLESNSETTKAWGGPIQVLMAAFLRRASRERTARLDRLASVKEMLSGASLVRLRRFNVDTERVNPTVARSC